MQLHIIFRHTLVFVNMWFKGLLQFFVLRGALKPSGPLHCGLKFPSKGIAIFRVDGILYFSGVWDYIRTFLANFNFPILN